MPARQINFLSERRKSLTKTEHQDLQLIKIVGGVFGVIVLICAVLISIRVYLGRQFSQVQESEKLARAQIVDNETIERSFVIFVYKLTAMTNITQDKEAKNEAITFFSQLFGEDVFIKQMSFLEKEKILSLRIQSESVFSLQEVFRKLSEDDVRGRFASLSPSNLLRTPAGDYEMSITAVLKQTATASAQASFPVMPLETGAAGTPQ